VYVRTRVWALVYVNKRPNHSTMTLGKRLFVSTFKIGCIFYGIATCHECTNFLKRSEPVKIKSSVIHLKLLKLLITLHKTSVFLNSLVTASDISVCRFPKINHIDADK
jgi:hypothetical protein